MSKGSRRTVIGIVGDRTRVQQLPWEAFPGVERAVPVLKPFKFVSRDFQSDESVVEVGPAKLELMRSYAADDGTVLRKMTDPGGAANDVDTVENVFLDYGAPASRPLTQIGVEEAKQYIAQGQFEKGSMLPKIEAAIDFLGRGGERVIITSPENLARSVEENSGTHIVH